MNCLTKLFVDVDHNVKYITVGEDVDYCFKQEGPTLYIYLEPSNGKLDWKHNFMFAKRPYKDMKIPYRVHRGFLKCWKYIEDIVIEKIKDTSIREIIVVGYSHGGALSMLCHECCWFHRPDIRDNIWGIGFDSPRVYAGFKVKKALKERWAQYIVIRNHTDLVTHVPPFIFGYRHVGKLVKIGKHKKYGFIKSHYQTNILWSLAEFEYNYRWKELIKSKK